MIALHPRALPLGVRAMRLAINGQFVPFLWLALIECKCRVAIKERALLMAYKERIIVTSCYCLAVSSVCLLINFIILLFLCSYVIAAMHWPHWVWHSHSPALLKSPRTVNR